MNKAGKWNNILSFLKFDMLGNTKNNMSKFAVSSEGQTIVKYNPENN